MKETKNTIINIPIEFKRLFDKDWREAAIFGGRFCFDGNTVISMSDGSFKNIRDLKIGDEVLSLNGFDRVIDVTKFKKDFDPKPMITLNINGVKTKTTYDHKYFNGKTYVPIYQLIWGIMASSQRRELELLCKQYGENTNNELQVWLQNKGDETSEEQEWLFNDGGKRKSKDNSQGDSKNIYSKPREQGDGQSQEWNKGRQQGREFRVDDKKGTVSSSMGNRTKNRPSQYGKQFQDSNRKGSERIIAIQIRLSDNANKNDGRTIRGENWTELRWDTGFARWKNMEAFTGRISTQKTDNLGSKEGWVRVESIDRTRDVWSISTERYHNYFANGVNVSNSLKSHTVARTLLIRARQNKIRVACFREFQNSIAESSYQLLADLIKKYNLTDFELTQNSIVNKITGSDFIFRGLWNNEQSIKSIEGIDIAWIEEAQTVSEKSIEVLTPTVRKDGSQIIYTYNRLLEDDPVHKRLVLEGRPNTLIINVNYDIAEKHGWLPDVIRDEIEDDKKNRPKLYKHKWLGEPFTDDIKIYRDWNRIDEIPHEARLERYGLDFGYTNDPSSIVAIYYYNGGYILDEILYQKGLSNKEIADTLKNLDRALVIADSAEPKSIDEIKSYGINILPCQKGKDSVKFGIQFVQDQKISYTSRSYNLEREYKGYIWKVDKNGVILNTPDAVANHALDAVRYGLDSFKPCQPIRFLENNKQEYI